MKKIGVKLHKERCEILGFCKRHDRLFLYGSGWVGKALLQYLEEEGIEIAAFCVSDGHKHEKTYCGKKVYELSEITFQENDGIILGVGGDFQHEICRNLCSIGIPERDIYVHQIYVTSTGLIRNDSYVKKAQDDTYFENYVQLDQIGKQTGTDKCSDGHSYLNKYEFFLNKWRDKNINILELGVYRGSSLNLWSSYFHNAVIFGVDISEECIQYSGENRKVIIQDLGNEDDMDYLKSLHPTIIIDDASHLWSHQIKALYHLLPALQSGGVYIVEDLGTSFFSCDHQYYADAVVTAYDFCTAIAEVVTSRALLRTTHLQADMLPLKQEIEYLAEQITMISFVQQSCIIIKK